MAKILAQNMFDAAFYELEHLPGLSEIAVLKRKTTTKAPIRKVAALKPLSAGGVGAKPRTAAELQLESERIKAEVAGKAQPSLIESTLAPFINLGMIGIGAILVVNLLPPILDAMKQKRKE